MQGPSRALLVIMPCMVVPYLFPLAVATVVLVLLRRGPGDALLLSLPAAVLAAWHAGRGDVIPLATLLYSLPLAMALRNFRSWPLVLVLTSLGGCLMAVTLLVLGGDYLIGIRTAFEQVIEGWRQSGYPVQEVPIPDPLRLAGLFGVALCVASLGCLLLARFWQAALYNPGGFREEFHHLRLSGRDASALFVAGLASGYWLPGWSWIFLFPLLVTGLGMAHYWLAAREVSSLAVTLLYLSLLLLPVRYLLVALAVVDGWQDLAGRQKGREPRPPDEETRK